MADIQKLNVNNTTYDISTTWEKVTGKPSTFTPSSHTHSYLPLSGGTMTGAINLSNTNAKLAFGSLATSPITGYKAPSLLSNGVGIYSRYGGSSDEGAIIVTEDTCVIYNSADTGWNFQVMDKDLGSDMTNDATRTFGVNQNHQAWSLSGFVKSGSSNNYVLLGGGDHKSISDFATAGHTHDNVYSKKYSYSLPSQKCVKITYDGYTPVIISACRSNGKGQFLLAGLGYGEGGWTRNQFRCLIPSPYVAWKLSATACTVELYNTAATPGDVIVTVITTGNIIFTAADTLSGAEDTKRFACFDELTWNNITSKPTIPTNTNQLTNGAGFITGITKSMVTTALGYTPPTSDTNTWRPVTNTYTGSDQSTCVSQYGTNALYNALVNGYASSAGYSNGVLRIDDRDDNTSPYEDIKGQITWHLKTNSSVGLPSTRTYSGVMILSPWSDSSGGAEHWLAFNSNGYIYHRYGTSSWNSWKTLCYTDHTHTKSQITDFPTSLPASDVYSWAKASSKPSYTYSEVGAAAASHTHNYAGSSSAGGAATSVVVADSNANSTYRMVWHSGNSLYSTDNIYCNPSADYLYSKGFYQTSDERLKTFYDPIKPDLEKLRKLRKNYFKFNDKDKLEIGVSAQEIQSIYPEIVSENSDGYLSVAYDKLSVIALAAIDEQQNIINEQNNKIDQLEKRLKAIENILSKLTS